jgi:hypothetical protein
MVYGRDRTTFADRNAKKTVWGWKMECVKMEINGRCRLEFVLLQRATEFLSLLVFVETLQRFGCLIDHLRLKHCLSVTDGPHISLFTSESLHSSLRILSFFFLCQYDKRRQWQTTPIQLNLPRKSSIGSPRV